MKKLTKNLTVLSFALAIIVAGVCNVQAFEKGHRFVTDAKLIAALNLSSSEQTALETAVSTYGPAVKAARKAFHVAKKQLHTDLTATTPNGTQLVADATALANAKFQLKAERAQLDSALNAALTPAHLQQLKNEITTQFQSRLSAKTDHLLFGYVMYLERQ